MDNELFKLCKEVRDRTEWRLLTVGSRFYVAKPAIQGKRRVELYDKYKILPIEEILNDYGGEAMDEDKDSFIPIYTSDYLLDKLEDVPVDYHLMDSPSVEIHFGGRKRKFAYRCRAYLGFDKDYTVYADTLLKALLKLTIALSETGELK